MAPGGEIHAGKSAKSGANIAVRNAPTVTPCSPHGTSADPEPDNVKDLRRSRDHTAPRNPKACPTQAAIVILRDDRRPGPAVGHARQHRRCVVTPGGRSRWSLPPVTDPAAAVERIMRWSRPPHQPSHPRKPREPAASPHMRPKSPHGSPVTCVGRPVAYSRRSVGGGPVAEVGVSSRVRVDRSGGPGAVGLRRCRGSGPGPWCDNSGDSVVR